MKKIVVSVVVLFCNLLFADTPPLNVNVNLTAPSYFNVSGVPLRNAGTIAITGASQSANVVLASPDGSSGVLSPRSLTSTDIPSLTSSKVSDFQTSVSANTDVTANTSARHSAVTLGTANGLSLSTQQLSLQASDATHTGALTSTDWGTFNSKESALTFSAPLSRSVNTVSIPAATSSVNGYLSSTDWSTFNNKVSTARNINTTSPLTGGGTLASDLTLAIPVATSSVNGYLSSTDWSTFNNKEPAITSGTTAKYWRGDKTFQTLDTSVVTENTNLYYTQGRFDTAFAAKTTSNLTEGSNLYYTTARFDTALSTKTTSNLTEGSNLYYTNARVDTEFDTRLATKTTTNLAEGANLYYTAARVQALAASSMPAQNFYVTKDVGNDANSCSLMLPCKTIQRGINVANAISAYYKQTIVHVAPASGGTGSSYNENITFSQQGVNVICDAWQSGTRACLISGSITIDMTGTTGGANYVAASNESYMSGFVAVVSSGDTVTFSGSTFQRFIMTNMYIDNNGTGSAAVISNSGSSGGNKSTFISYDSVFSNNNSTNPSVALSNGRFWMFGTQPVIQQTTATNKAVIQSGAASSFVCNLCAITGQVQVTDNTANATLNLSTITSGSAACVDTPSSANVGLITLAFFGCTSTNTNTATGSGVVVLTPGNVRLSSSGDIIGTVTQIVLPGLPQGEIMLGAGATTGTNVLLSIKNGHIKIDQTTSPTAVVNANAGTSATCTLSNASDSAGLINLTEGSGSWASGTQCTITFNKAYGVAPICTFSANNAATAGHQVSQQVNITTTTTTMIVTFGVADSAATAYKMFYHCLETK